MNTHILAKAAAIKLLILDIDGVLTDGKLYYTAAGEELKVFHAHDGAGIKLLQQTGVEVAVISCRNSPAVTKRLTELGVRYVYQGQAEKTAAFFELCKLCNLSGEQIAYVGDDFPDLAVMALVGLSIAVANATPTVKSQADWQTEIPGGFGAVREVCEMILSAQTAGITQAVNQDN